MLEGDDFFDVVLKRREVFDDLIDLRVGGGVFELEHDDVAVEALCVLHGGAFLAVVALLVRVAAGNRNAEQ
jgi:hypothetical protein